ncbi:MAG: LysR family transcriptional regulator [Rhizobiaceae bacterium]
MWLSDLDLRLLRVFKAVAEAGGFVNAQGILGINQPAISSHVANLEQRIGVRLCERGRGGFSLTPDGREVLAEANELLERVDDCSKRLNALGKKAALLARVGVVDGILTNPCNPLTGCMRNSKARFSDMRLRVGVYDHLDCLSELRAKRLDICIIGLDNSQELSAGLDKIHLFDERASFYCAPVHPCAKVQDEDECLRRLKSSRVSAHSFAHNAVDADLDLILRDENIEIAQSNVESTVYLTISGSHVGLIPDHIADPWVAQSELMPIAQDRFHVISAFHALRLQDTQPNIALEHLWKELQDATR